MTMVALFGTVRWRDRAIAVGDDQWPVEMDYPGRLLSVKGSIETLGSGGGTQTTYQLRNVRTGQNLLKNAGGSFEVDSASRLLEGAVVDNNQRRFQAGDVVQLDCDASSTAPADAVLEGLCVFFVSDA